MFKKFGIIIPLFCLWSINAFASMHTIAISERDFCKGNSLLIVTRSESGQEQVTGYVPFQQGKTQFSQDEIGNHSVELTSITNQKEAIIAEVEQGKDGQGEESLVHLYIELDSTVNLIRVLVVNDTLLADNPFTVLEFSTISYLDEEDDFFESGDDEFSSINLTDIKPAEKVKISLYESVVSLLTYQKMATKRKVSSAMTWVWQKLNIKKEEMNAAK